jgi:hypothetical protein
MKLYKNIILGALAVFAVSCEDAIDITQVGLLDADAALQTTTDLQDALFGAYNRLDTSPEIHFNAVFTDEIRIGYSNGGQGQTLYRQQFTSANAGPTTLWLRNYQGITRASRIIEAAGSIDSSADQAVVDDIVGQAHAIRAFLHLQLLQYYSPDLTDPSSLGIPVIDFVAGTGSTPLRNTTGETFTAIFTDLDSAAGLITAQNSVTFFSKDAVNAMRARAYSYSGDYTSAAPIAAALLSAYPLANTSDYNNMMDDTGTAEVIMKLERTINDSYDGQGSTGSSSAGGWAGASFAFSAPDLAGGPYYEMATNLWLAYDDADLRRDNNGKIFPNVAEAGRDVFLVNKYRGSEGQPLMNDLKIFRSGEMLLILAEARAAASDASGVAGFIDDLRDSRFGADQPTPVYANITEAWGSIVDERRLEFAFEGRRYIDLRRLGALGNRGIDRANMDCASFGACDLPLSDYRFSWPIPLNEFNGNPGLRAQQNTGY